MLQEFWTEVYFPTVLDGQENGLRNARWVPIIMLDSLLQWFIVAQHNLV